MLLCMAESSPHIAMVCVNTFECVALVFLLVPVCCDEAQALAP